MITLRPAIAALDSLICWRAPSRARYQAALMTPDGQLLRVEAATFRHLANAEWWIHDWAPRRIGKIQPWLAPGSQWIIQDLT